MHTINNNVPMLTPAKDFCMNEMVAAVQLVIHTMPTSSGAALYGGRLRPKSL